MTHNDKTMSILSEQDLLSIKRPIPSSDRLQQSILLQTKGLKQDNVLDSDDSVDNQAESWPASRFRSQVQDRRKLRFSDRVLTSVWGKPAFAIAASGVFAVIFLSLSVPPTIPNPSSIAVEVPERNSQIELAELEFQDSMLLGNELLFEML